MLRSIFAAAERRLAAAERHLFARKAYKFWLKSWLPPADTASIADMLATLRHTRICEPIEIDAPKGRILVLAAHTDDEVIGPGGTLIKARQQGSKIHTLYLSTNRPAEITQTEACAAAARIGSSTTFLNLPILKFPLSAAQQLAAEIEKFRPTVLLTPFVLDDHTDHRRANELLMHADNITPLKCEVWAYQVYSVVPGNVLVDVTAQIDEKRKAIEEYRTQSKKRDWAHYSVGMAAYNSRFLRQETPAYAESFLSLPASEYIELCRRFFDTPNASYYPPYGAES